MNLSNQAITDSNCTPSEVKQYLTLLNMMISRKTLERTTMFQLNKGTMTTYLYMVGEEIKALQLAHDVLVEQLDKKRAV